MVRRRASQVSRSAVSGLIGPAPSSSGAPCSLRCTISVVGLRLGPATPPAPPAPPPAAAALSACPWARATSASAAECCHSSALPAALLSIARWCLAMLRMACSKTRPCSSGKRPLSASSRPARVQVMLNERRSYNSPSSTKSGGQSVRAANAIRLGALPTETRQLSVALGRRILGGGCDLVECQHARAECLLERRQAAQRLARARQPHSRAVVATRDLRQPLRNRRAARRPPVTLIISLAHDLREPLLDARLGLAQLTHLTPPPLTATLKRLIDRPLQSTEHTFDPTSPPAPKVCAE